MSMLGLSYRVQRKVAKLTHTDARGRAQMVDISAKPVTVREAVAAGEVKMRPVTLRLIARGSLPKGDVLAVARIAGISAAKRTSELIPLCHPLPIEYVELNFTPRARKGRLLIEARVRLEARTGAEMEALTAVAVAGLTVYDMCKAVDREMEIGPVYLVSKSGGRTGRFTRG